MAPPARFSVFVHKHNREKPVVVRFFLRFCLISHLFNGLLLLGALPISEASAQQVNIYSFRHDFLVEPLLNRFEDTTGIMVNIVSGNADVMIKRLAAEGAQSMTDLLLTVDAGRLERAKALGLLQPVSSAKIEQALPSRYRDKDKMWFGLSVRARPILYNRQHVKPWAVKDYTDLSDRRWRGRLCLRDSKNIYNQSLVAGYLAHKGAAQTRLWVRGMVANLAQRPQGNDIDQIKYVAAAVCHFSVVNTYYLARLLKSENPQEQAAARQVGVIWPDQEGDGTHINVSAVALARYAPNREAAIRFIEFLLTEDAQRLYSEQILEYPVVSGVPVAEIVKSLGPFREDTLSLNALGIYNAQARQIMKDEGWD